MKYVSRHQPTGQLSRPLEEALDHPSGSGCEYGVVNWVRAKRLAELTGHTVKAIDRKRQRHVWKENDVWVLRDGGIYYSIAAYNAWVARRPQRILC